MAMIGSRRPVTRVVLWAALFTVSSLTLAVSAARASTAQEEHQGAEVLRELEAGNVQCAKLSDEDFEHVGDYAMGRMLGSTSRHEAMDETMTRMMGATGERQMHEAMGHRFSGCGGGKLPAGFGRMMGAFGAVGMMGGGGRMGGFGEGGPYEGGPYGPSGSMMGGGHWNEANADDNGSDGPSAAAMVGMMAVLIGAVAVAVLWLSRRRPRGPLDTLKRRYAAGDITSEEYEKRRRLLEGS
jgi:hypothetical protein